MDDNDRTPCKITLGPPTRTTRGMGTDHELVFTRDNQSNVIALTTEELRELFKAAFDRLKLTNRMTPTP